MVASLRRAVVVGAAAFSLAQVANAQVTQPNGTVIPQGNNLVNALNAAGETIDPLADAATTPETFSPLCELTFTVIARGAGQKNSFGWYNVTGVQPTIPELFEFIGCNDGVGTVRTLDVRSDPRWTGGDIGFFQATTQGTIGNCVNLAMPIGTLGHLFYSEARYNPDNNPLGSTIHLLIMDSKVRPESFYFGWEDLFMMGDNDFEDLLMRVDGIQCSGGGEPCDTGMLGGCGIGVTQCVNGVVECIQRTFPGTESCNAIDDDCNGTVDDGDLCASNEICDQGVCIPSCSGGEFNCDPGLVCRADGFCVDPACETVTCPAEQRCEMGVCVGGCDGVVCPFKQTCIAGRCVDPCQGVMCGAGTVCENGACINTCDCGGRFFDPGTNQCVDNGCQGVACPPGEHCVMAFGCMSDCDGAVCPAGQACDMGLCGDVPAAGGSAGMTGSGATGGTFGVGGGSGGTTMVGGAGGVGGAAGASGSGTGAGTFGFGGGNSGDEGGCGCRAAGSRRSTAAGLLALLGIAGLLRRRQFARR